MLLKEIKFTSESSTSYLWISTVFAVAIKRTNKDDFYSSLIRTTVNVIAFLSKIYFLLNPIFQSLKIFLQYQQHDGAEININYRILWLKFLNSKQYSNRLQKNWGTTKFNSWKGTPLKIMQISICLWLRSGSSSANSQVPCTKRNTFTLFIVSAHLKMQTKTLQNRIIFIFMKVQRESAHAKCIYYSQPIHTPRCLVQCEYINITCIHMQPSYECTNAHRHNDIM